MANLKSERKILKDYGITAHPRSGRGRFLKADGSDDMFVWDVKEAEKSFHFNQGVWNKICSDAYHVDPYKNPGLLIVLGGKTELALIEAPVLKAIRQELKELKEALIELKQSDDT
jgi:hypothetical protein